MVVLLILFPGDGYPGPTPDKNNHSILGKWDSRIRSNGSGLTLEFLPNGTFKENGDFEKEGGYVLKENHLTTRTWDNKGEKQRTFDLTLASDGITMKEPNGTAEINLERVCKSGSASNDVFGEWFSPNYPGAIPVFPAEMPLRFPVFVEFTRDKRVFFRSIPVKSTQGQYEFLDGALVLKLPDESPLKSKPHVTSDQADIRIATKGPEIPFRRVTGSECASQPAPSKQP